ncbi:DUF899 domain-containing protein [Massilia dura]|uniref:DUF899 domain-containing protein n=1 Tax=Pseudoduganella dura TaxID=321982 RepID=A0A6I3XA98_9BURK|nr:DUF899 domain-containing protein [Pseudoduganella dura]
MNNGTAARESAPCRAARDRLLEEEIALRRLTGAVAEQRRRLPPGTPVPRDCTEWRTACRPTGSSSTGSQRRGSSPSPTRRRRARSCRPATRPS